MNKLARLTLMLTLLSALAIFSGCGGGSKSGEDEIRTYTVTFITNGGSSIPNRQIKDGDTLTEPAAPTRAEHAFEGWYVNPEQTARASFPMTVTRDITLYAKWIWLAGTEIETPGQFYDIRNDLSGRYRLATDISLSSWYVNWPPIGTKDAPFTGRIDGNGYKIIGLKVDRIAAYAGLFGYVKGGEITNLVVENVDVAGGGYSGAIAGVIESGTINGCFVSGKIASSSSPAADMSSSGGVAGSVIDSVIADCDSVGEIFAKDDAGGIAGSLYNSRIINSSSTADIESYSDLADSVGMSGGIAGYVEESEITGCASFGNVISISDFPSSGGIVGGLTYDGIISDSYSMGDIESYSYLNTPRSSVSGGIAGYTWYGTVNNSFSVGNITSTSTSGGIVGSSEGEDTITNCAAINWSIDADHDAGRIVGYVFYPGFSIISNNFALKDMIADGIAKFDDKDEQLYGVGKSDGDLKKQTTYSAPINGNGLGGLGWKFGGSDASPWRMPTNDYPMLYWEY